MSVKSFWQTQRNGPVGLPSNGAQHVENFEEHGFGDARVKLSNVERSRGARCGRCGDGSRGRSHELRGRHHLMGCHGRGHLLLVNLGGSRLLGGRDGGRSDFSRHCYRKI